MKSEIGKKELRESIVKKYCVSSVLKLESVREKAKQTKIELYGDSNYNNREMAKKTRLDRNNGKYLSDESIEKIKRTKKERYGDENYVNPEKTKKTCIERYGVDSPMKVKEILKRQQEKYRKNYFEKTRFNFNLENPDVRKKALATTLKKYGHNCLYARYRYDNITFDSSYELCLYVYLKDYGCVFEYHPNIELLYTYNDTKFNYFVDFIIYGRLYEVKSRFFLDDENNLIKRYKDDDQGKLDAKSKCMRDNDVILLTENELDVVFRYIEHKYNIRKYTSFTDVYKIV